MGTFTNITHRHDTHSVSTPPATSPVAPPAADTVVKSPMARTRGAPSGRRVGEQGERGGGGQSGADPLEGPGSRAASNRSVANPPSERAHGEQGDAEQERAAAAEQVSGAGTEQQQTAEGQDVGVEHPGQAGAREAQARAGCAAGPR